MVHCTVCKFDSINKEPFGDVSVDIMQHNTLVGALNGFFSPQRLESESAYDCARCFTAVRAYRHSNLSRVSKILSVQLKRFGNNMEKISKHIQFDEYLTVPVGNEFKRARLLAVIVHSGERIDSGHYYAYTRINDNWFLNNDTHVTNVSCSQVANDQAYILMFHFLNHLT